MCLVDQSMANWFLSASDVSISRSDFEATEGLGANMDFEATGDPFWDSEDGRWFRPFNVVRAADGAGVLVLPIQGSLYSHLTGQLGRWATGSPYITAYQAGRRRDDHQSDRSGHQQPRRDGSGLIRVRGRDRRRCQG